MNRVALLMLCALFGGCYLSHRRPEDAGGDAPTRCGAASCALVAPRETRFEVMPLEPRLTGRFEAVALGIDPGAEDGLAVQIDTCGVGCPRTILITGIGADLADPAVLSGPVEVSLRDRALVMRADPCPGCDDGGVAAQLVLAVVAGELSEGFDLPLRDVTVAPGDQPCESRGPASDASGRYRLSFGLLGRTVVLDEGETRGLGGDYAARLVRSSFTCVTPDLPTPRPLEASTWVVYAVGPR
jgi:hypothetical protein